MPDDRRRGKSIFPPNFTTPVPGTLREVLDNDTIPRDEGTKKGKYGGASMMLKKVTEVNQYSTVFNYRTPIPQKELISKDKKIVSGPGMNTEPKYFS